MHGESPGERGDKQQQARDDDAIVARQRAGNVLIMSRSAVDAS
jgi:hypothetical protein